MIEVCSEMKGISGISLSGSNGHQQDSGSVVARVTLSLNAR